MRFEFPLAFCLLVFLPLIYGSNKLNLLLGKFSFFHFFIEKEKSSIPLTLRTNIKAIPSSLRARLALFIPNMMRVSIWLLLVIALARPQKFSITSNDNLNARDIMFLVDTSGSMAALDFTYKGEHLDRLSVLKYVVKDFILKRSGDRIGLIVFGDEVYTLSPLTSDHEMLNQILASIEIGMAGDGTALGDAIAVSLRRIKSVPAETKAIILITDGMRTSGAIDPRDATDLAKIQNTKIYTIGIGSDKPVPFKVKSLLGLDTIEYRELPLDEKTLQYIANTTGAKYFNAKNTTELESIYKEIDKLETRPEKSIHYTEIKELFIFPLIISIILLVLHETLGATVFRTLS